MQDTKPISEHAFVTKSGMYIVNADDLGHEELMTFINENRQRSSVYRHYYDLYTGQHKILRKPHADSVLQDSRLVSNWANYVVDTYVGYYIGKPPKISLEDATANGQFQDWLNTVSFQDRLSEVAKQVAIYGKSYILAYQDENSASKIAVVSPDEGFLVYSASIDRKPIAFVRYSYLGAKLSGEVYTDHDITYFGDDGRVTDTANHLFKAVPAVEFFANDERLSIVGKIASLVDAYDYALSQKANQVAYFDQAYLKILGIPLPTDDDGNPQLSLIDDRVLYAPNDDAANGVVDFISKPDGDTMQENLLARLKDDIFQTAMVANLNDEAFAGNSSGVAIKYKLLSMQNQAAFEDRKFTISLRKLFGIVLPLGAVIGSVERSKVLSSLSITPARNVPQNIENEAQTASTLSGVVSKETQLSTLSIVDDPQKEIERMREEQNEELRNSLLSMPSLTDQDLIGDRDDQ